MPDPLASGSGVSAVVNMLEAKTHLSRLVEAIETGAENEVVIARNGGPVARLTGLQAPPRPLHPAGFDRCAQSPDRRSV
jgi:antitoxin (DNA-binding transcriptional repressor) of toxin-antitoxin stability system